MNQLDKLKALNEVSGKVMREKAKTLKGLEVRSLGMTVSTLDHPERFEEALMNGDEAEINRLRKEFRDTAVYIDGMPKLTIVEKGAVKILEIVVSSSEAEDEALLYKLIQLEK